MYLIANVQLLYFPGREKTSVCNTEVVKNVRKRTGEEDESVFSKVGK